MVAKNLWTLLVLMSCSYLFGQDLSGRVLDQYGEPVAYANIGFLGFNLGTVTNADGSFVLNFDRAEDMKIAVSCIGYKGKSFNAIKMKHDLQKGHDIIIDKAAFELPEIQVRPREWVTRKVGNFVKTDMISAGFSENILGKEAGVRMKIRNKPAYLEEVSIHIARCEYDSVFFRLNVYQMDGRNIGEIILTTPIYINLAKEEIDDQIIVDVSNYNIRVEDDFLVSLEQVKDLGEGGLYFYS